MKIVVFGLGYVGLSNSVLLAGNHEVVAVDLDEERVKLVNQRLSPIKDEGIEDSLMSGCLDIVATTDSAGALENSDFAFIATPTDYDIDTGVFNTDSVESVLSLVAEVSPTTVAVIKSTVPVGFTELMAERFPRLNIVFSPEFLREGRALYDNQHPSRIIAASRSKASAEKVAALLQEGAQKDDVPILISNSTEAEAVKLFSNTYLAMRVAFFNELDSFARVKGLDPRAIIDGVSLDPRIGGHYNNPSFGYGGYCLPKDTRQLLANYDGIPQSMMTAVVESNALRKSFIANQVLERLPKVVGIYRLTMKSGSDNFRSSSVQDVMAILRNRGVGILVYEPTWTGAEFDGFEVVRSFDEFINRVDVVLTNRFSVELEPYTDKVFTADIYARD
ncbi:UDP-glucose 6-dehydrogenase [Corynebacterium sp. HMSC06D04]|uniref:nucleotide sugar dehydrogenase n=1 Tax=unclassified Corynebacterium TaxID=2624378 RepID=UPI0008A27F08|nr:MULTISPECIES: nucleotide sugar dehydrogenase [unclassified Corynebacterium]OFT34795.1 UDP-glucose 6-dehydrogenase [Corynebacterium sp. HMSC08C04]OFT50924.1 UDP-glucose 6-dehydrogenase [Corynebacterium sp. HMSC06D04]